MPKRRPPLSVAKKKPKAARGKSAAKGTKKKAARKKPTADTGGTPEPLPTPKLQAGLAEAKLLIRDMVRELAAAMGDDAELTEVGCVLSFSADGKFLGVGAGGATSLRCKFRVK